MVELVCIRLASADVFTRGAKKEKKGESYSSLTPTYRPRPTEDRVRAMRTSSSSQHLIIRAKVIFGSRFGVSNRLDRSSR